MLNDWENRRGGTLKERGMGTGQNHPAWARGEREEAVPLDGRVEIEEYENEDDGADP